MSGMCDDNVCKIVALVASVAAANGAHMQRYCTPAERVVTTAFHSSAVPPIPLADYGHRIAKYTNQPVAVAVAAVALMLRYQSACPRAEYALVPTNVHRLLFAASLVAAKTNSDVFYSNKYYAQVGGVPEAEAHKLEASLLDALNWSVLVSKDEYDAVLRAAGVTGSDAAAKKLTAIRPVVTFQAIVAAEQAAQCVPAAEEAPEREAESVLMSMPGFLTAPGTAASSLLPSPSLFAADSGADESIEQVRAAGSEGLGPQVLGQ